MGKHEAPAYRMRIERGKLVPLTAFDAERLNSYQNGSELRVAISQKKNDKLLRKYWAVLGKVVSDCPTPWKNKDQASEALKLALGIVDYGKTVGDKFFQYPKSLSELDEPEFRAYYEESMGLLHRITGVDPEQLGAEIPDVGEDHEQNTETSALAPSVDAGSDIDAIAPNERVASASIPADEADNEPGEELNSSSNDLPGSTTISGLTRMLMEECIDGMLRESQNALATATQREAKIAKLVDVFLDSENLPQHRDFIELCAETARRIIGKPSEEARARSFLTGKIPAAQIVEDL